jgi:hypothetical protein
VYTLGGASDDDLGDEFVGHYDSSGGSAGESEDSRKGGGGQKKRKATSDNNNNSEEEMDWDKDWETARNTTQKRAAVSQHVGNGQRKILAAKVKPMAKKIKTSQSKHTPPVGRSLAEQEELALQMLSV